MGYNNPRTGKVMPHIIALTTRGEARQTMGLAGQILSVYEIGDGRLMAR